MLEVIDESGLKLLALHVNAGAGIERIEWERINGCGWQVNVDGWWLAAARSM